MGAKKRNKGNKLSRMSEEEKIRYLQHRAAVEEEAKRRKEQLLSTFLKNKLRREQIFSRINEAKINQQWRQILRQMKCFELKHDIEDLSKWFNYTIDKKNKKIEGLLRDLDVAEKQYFYMHSNHIETIKKLTEIHEQRINYFYKYYKQEKNQIKNKAIADMNDIIKSYANDEEQLHTALYLMDEAFKEKTSLITIQQSSKIDELTNNMLTDMEALKNSRESQIENLWRNFESILKQYWEQTNDRRKEYLIMRDLDYENCKQIFENNQQINAVIDTINNLKDQYAKILISDNQKILYHKERKEKSRQIFRLFKKEILNEIKADKEKLNFMNSKADKETNKLKEILRKGEQILQLQLLCGKFETFDEKLFPGGHGKPALTKEEENNVEEQYQKFMETLPKAIFTQIIPMDGFWKRFNHIFLEKEALALHIQSLTRENKHLKKILRNYFSNYVVKQPESKISHANGVRFTHRRPATSIETKRRNNFSLEI